LLTVALLTVALLTVALLTVALLTVALLTVALLTVALLTVALLTVALLMVALRPLPFFRLLSTLPWRPSVCVLLEMVTAKWGIRCVVVVVVFSISHTNPHVSNHTKNQRVVHAAFSFYESCDRARM